MIPVQPGDHVSARHDGQVLVGTVYRLDHAADTIALLTTNGVATIPADAIVAVESIARLVDRQQRGRGWDPDHPDEQPIVRPFSAWEWTAAAGIGAGFAIAGAGLVGAMLGAGWAAFRWLS